MIRHVLLNFGSNNFGEISFPTNAIDKTVPTVTLPRLGKLRGGPNLLKGQMSLVYPIV